MRVFLDDQPLTVPRPTLAAALAAAVKAADARGRMVVEARLDGQRLSDADLEAPRDTPESATTELRMLSAEPRSLVRVTLLDAADALDGARRCQTESARLIQTGKVEDSLAQLSDALATWQAVRNVVEMSAAVLGLPLDSAGACAQESCGHDHDLGPYLSSLSAGLEEIKRSLGHQDWSSLADALAYDMDEQVDRWKVLLSDLADHAAPPAPTPPT